MSRFLDRLLVHGTNLPDPSRLAGATVINATAIANYLFAEAEPKLFNPLTDAPNVAPPWPNCFIEFAMSHQVYIPPPRGEGWTLWEGPPMFGLHCLAAEQAGADGKVFREALDLAIDQEMSVSLATRAKETARMGRWLMYVQIYSEPIKNQPQGPQWLFLFQISEEGRFMTVLDDSGKPVPLLLDKATHPEEWDRGITDGVLRTVWMTFAITMMTFSFCHCRNVVLPPVTPPRALSVKHQKRHGRPLVQYHEVVIQPIRRILDTEGNRQADGFQRALHICRGHFKTYQARGLFGKLSGTYWWPNHTRGNPRVGIRVTDYRSLPPIDQNDVAP